MSDVRPAALAHYEALAQLARALASPVRLRLVDLLRQGGRTVEALAAEAGVSVANASQHLQQLRRACVVTAEPNGPFVTYRVAGGAAAALFLAVRVAGEALLPALDRLRRDLGALTPEAREALLARIRRGEVTLLDVRPSAEYHAGHLPGARGIPFAELPARVVELPRDREVVAYCRGPYCSLAVEAVAVLRSSGYRASHLDLGVPELRARRFRIVTGGAGPTRPAQPLTGGRARVRAPSPPRSRKRNAP